MAPRLSIIIPTLHAAGGLPPTLDALLPGVAAGIIREVIVVDGGSRDQTCEIAVAAGAQIVKSAPGRGGQLRAGAEIARADWLLFLHADTQLGPDWVGAAAHHMQNEEGFAAVFKLRFAADGIAARLVAGWANLRTRVFQLPYGDQGLLIPRVLYHKVHGFPDQPLMEDVAIMRRLKGRFRRLDVTATTSADRYLREGWFRRGTRNLLTLLRYLAGAEPEHLAGRYHKR